MKFFGLQKGSAQPHVYSDDIAELQIPDPGSEIQEKIVAECVEIDNEYNAAQTRINELRDKIAEEFSETAAESNKKELRLSDENILLSIGRRVLKTEIQETGVPIYSANVVEPFGYSEKPFFEDYALGSVLWGIDGDWEVNYIQPQVPFFPTDHCGVLRVLNNTHNPHYLAFALKQEGERQNFSRSYRASTDRIRALSLFVPPRESQDKFISDVEQYEAEIKRLEDAMRDVNERRKAVLEKYLNPT